VSDAKAFAHGHREALVVDEARWHARASM